jgi:hypothetical protein
MQQSADDIVGIFFYRRSEHEHKEKTDISMTADNSRKEEKSKAQAGKSEESSVPFPNSAMADKTVEEKSFLPSPD